MGLTGSSGLLQFSFLLSAAESDFACSALEELQTSSPCIQLVPPRCDSPAPDDSAEEDSFVEIVDDDFDQIQLRFEEFSDADSYGSYFRRQPECLNLLRQMEMDDDSNYTVELLRFLMDDDEVPETWCELSLLPPAPLVACPVIATKCYVKFRDAWQEVDLILFPTVLKLQPQRGETSAETEITKVDLNSLRVRRAGKLR